MESSCGNAWLDEAEQVLETCSEYNKEHTNRFRSSIREKLRQAYNVSAKDFPLFGKTPLYIEMEFKFSLPKKFFVGGNRKNAMKADLKDIRCTKRPDVDNLTKFILDGLEGIFFKDDSTVVKIMASKSYHLMPPYEGEYSALC